MTQTLEKIVREDDTFPCWRWGFFLLDIERVFFHFIPSVLLENKTGCMSNRKMNTCLGCRAVREVCGVFQACYLVVIWS